MANFSISATTLTFPDGTTQTTAAQSIPSGTKTNFFQAAAPTGWTQCTTYTCYSMRIVNGTGGGTGGSVNFTTAFASQTPSGNVNSNFAVSATTLSTCQIPSHTHSAPNVGLNTASSGGSYPTQNYVGSAGYSTNATGGGGSHTHGFSGSAAFSGTAINLAVKYIDNIMATKN